MSERFDQYLARVRSLGKRIADHDAARGDVGNLPFNQYLGRTPAQVKALNRSAMAPRSHDRRPMAATEPAFRHFGSVETGAIRPPLPDVERAKQYSVYGRVMPSSWGADAAGKGFALPLTAAGTLAGLANVAAARAVGRDDAAVSFGNNAIQFEHGLFGEKDSAFTLGNAVLYGSNVGPETPSGRRYDGRKTSVKLAEHEAGHTYRYQDPGFVPRYIISRIADWFDDKDLPNRYKVEADDFAEEYHRRPR